MANGPGGGTLVSVSRDGRLCLCIAVGRMSAAAQQQQQQKQRR